MNDISVITLRGKRAGFTIVDVGDFERLNRFTWFKDERGYVMRGRGDRQGVITMHREVFDSPEGVHVDHKSHCLSDNTRRKLRLANRTQNARNRLKTKGFTSSRFKGVSLEQSGKWRAMIKTAAGRRTLGLFVCEEQAALAYNNAAIQFHGEFASLNVINAHLPFQTPPI